MDVGRLNPFAAAFLRAVQSVRGFVFLILLVPEKFEAVIEQGVDVLERNVVCCAAFGRHVSGVSGGEDEDSAEAAVAHAVTARQLSGFVHRDIVGGAGKTFDQARREWCCGRWRGIGTKEGSEDAGLPTRGSSGRRD